MRTQGPWELVDGRIEGGPPFNKWGGRNCVAWVEVRSTRFGDDYYYIKIKAHDLPGILAVPELIDALKEADVTGKWKELLERVDL